MSVTQAKWNDGQCCVENGIFFSDDSAIILSGTPREGYVARDRMDLSLLLEADPEGWTDIDENPTCRVEAGGVIATAGATSWEGEGFVAALRASDGVLLWVLHLNESEQFVELRHDGNLIEAVSSEYPDEYEWRIPLRNPEMLSVIVHPAI